MNDIKDLLVIEDDGLGVKTIYDGELEFDETNKVEAVVLSYSSLDKVWAKEIIGTSAGVIAAEGDKVRVVIPGAPDEKPVDVSFDWNQIEVMGILYTLYNQYMKWHDPAEVQIFDISEVDMDEN